MNRESIKVESTTIGEWVKRASDGEIVLPMIQRGSVWKPHKILDLWDTLLRGMPIGAQMVQKSEPGVKVVNLITRKLKEAPGNAVDLIDGQQRSLSILANWPGIGEQFDRAISVWVDLADEPQGDYKFRLHIATRAQPFGYQRAGMGGQALGKLPVRERRYANIVYVPDHEVDVQTMWKNPGFTPWSCKFALRLSDMQEHLDDLHDFVKAQLEAQLLEFKRLAEGQIPPEIKISESDQRKINEFFNKRAKFLENLGSGEKLIVNLDELGKALMRLPELQFPIIYIANAHDDEKTSEGDPSLAVLFKRIGTSGQDLSNADYIFSLIKHEVKEAHSLVEELLSYKRVASLYEPSDLVMSAVRMTLLSMRKAKANDPDQHVLKDEAKIDKATFAKLVRRRKDFLTTFEKAITTPDGVFANTLKNVLDAISYSESFDLGLPKHALPWLLNQSMFDVVLAWAWNQEKSILEKYRLSLVRFLLWSHVCVYDHDKASVICIRELEKRTEIQDFPDALLIMELIKGRCAYPFPSPIELRSDVLNGLVSSDDLERNEGLRGWARFDYRGYANGNLPEGERYKIEVYSRWWHLRRNQHTHPILLWLQRSYVYKQFEEKSALAGMTDETPYDFDHIVPQSHWGDWTGCGGENRLILFNVEKGAHAIIGNALGNLRVWSSSDNRSDGDNPPELKLKLGEKDANQICLDSVIEMEQISDWQCASSVKGYEKELRHWDHDRSLAFQRAVENRTFSLYHHFYEKLEMQHLEAAFLEGLTLSAS